MGDRSESLTPQTMVYLLKESSSQCLAIASQSNDTATEAWKCKTQEEFILEELYEKDDMLELEGVGVATDGEEEANPSATIRKSSEVFVLPNRGQRNKLPSTHLTNYDLNG